MIRWKTKYWYFGIASPKNFRMQLGPFVLDSSAVLVPKVFKAPFKGYREYNGFEDRYAKYLLKQQRTERENSLL